MVNWRIKLKLNGGICYVKRKETARWEKDIRMSVSLLWSSEHQARLCPLK